MSDLVPMSCPELPVERYAVELLASIRSPVLSSRLELLADNVNRVVEHYESGKSVDDQLIFVLDTLSSVLTLTISVLRYKSVDRRLAVHNIVTILRFIGDNFSHDGFPEFLSGVPRGTSEVNVPRGTKRTAKKSGVSK